MCASSAERNWSVYDMSNQDGRVLAHEPPDRANKRVYCHEVLHLKEKLQSAGYKQEAVGWDTDEASDDATSPRPRPGCVVAATESARYPPPGHVFTMGRAKVNTRIDVRIQRQSKYVEYVLRIMLVGFHHSLSAAQRSGAPQATCCVMVVRAGRSCCRASQKPQWVTVHSIVTFCLPWQFQSPNFLVGQWVAAPPQLPVQRATTLAGRSDLTTSSRSAYSEKAALVRCGL